MGILRFLVVGIIVVAGNSVQWFTTCSAAAPDIGPRPNAPATQAETANAQTGEIVRAQSLLAELRAAKFDGGRNSSPRRAGGSASAGRSRIQIGRDIAKLGRSAVPLLIAALNDPDPHVSAVAALALGRIGDPRAVEPMLKILESFLPVPKSEESKVPTGQLRAQACVCALGWLRDPRAVGPIVALEHMRNEPSDLIEGLGFRRDSWRYMCGIMPIVCGDAIQRIGPAAAPELVRLLSDADERVRSAATEHLSRFGVRDELFFGEMLLMAENRRNEDKAAEARNQRIASERAIADRVAALAGERLIALLHDKETDVRRAATTALGNLRVASAVAPLIERLNDEHPRVPSDTIIALGQIGDPAALDALARVLKNPGREHYERNAEIAVATIGGPKAFELLKSALQNADPNRRQAAIAGLSTLGTPAAIGLLIAALKDKDRHVRCDAARALGQLEGSVAARAIEPLLAATADEDAYVRHAALQGLGHLGDVRVVGPAMVALKEGSRSARQDALKILGQIKEPRSVEVVKAVLRDPDRFLRENAMDALFALNPPDLDECLRPMLDDKEKDIRYAAVVDLGRLEGGRAVRSVERLIAAARNDAYDMVRHAALFALGKIADPRAVDVALGALKDPDDGVRAEAIKLLGRMKPPGWSEAVKTMLKDPDSYVRYRAVEVLVEANARDLGDCLRQILKDDQVRVAEGLGDVDVAIAVLQASDDWVRAAALKALARIKDPKSVEAVARMLEDPDNFVRLKAVEALAQLDPPDLAERVRPLLLEEKNHFVHEAAVRVLRGAAKRAPAQGEKR